MLSLSAFQFMPRRETGRLRIDPGNHYLSNIANGNRFTTIFNEHTDEVMSLDVKDSYIASCSDQEIIMRKNGQHLWTYPIKPGPIEKAKVKIINNHLVFFCSMLGNHENHHDNQLLFLDLNTGSKVCEIERENMLGSGKVAFYGNSVFTLLCGDDKIKEWSPDGKCLKYIPTNSNAGILSCNQKYLIHAYQNRVSINYLTENRRAHIIHLPKSCPESQKIKCLFLDNNRLFCGLSSKSEKTLYDFHIIDLERKCISKSCLVSRTDTNAAITKKSYIKSIAAIKDHVFIGNSKGEIVNVDLNEEIQKYRILGKKHQSPVDKLIISNNMLISTSDYCTENNYLAEVKFWDLRTMKQINIATLPNIFDINFDNWSLVAGTEMSVVKWDFQNCHNGERFTEGSPEGVRVFDTEDDTDNIESSEELIVS